MTEDKSEKIMLKFKEESVSNVIYEEFADFGASVSSSAYRHAFEITRIIIKTNHQFHNHGRGVKRDKGTVMRNSRQLFNMIAFTGDRGTGKTSAMLSYMEFLKDYNRKMHSDTDLGSFYFTGHNENKLELMFTGLEYIDASLLGTKQDDVLRNVLPKMVKKWNDEEKRSYRDSGIVRDEDYSYKKRQMQMLFDRVYKSLKDLNSEKDILESDNDMFMETLENLSLTWNLRQSFQELVEAYLDIMEYQSNQEKIGLNDHFLVISIDDIDMNIEHGFELLEEIRKYLMVPHVIVLLSASYEQLEQICIEHYTKAFKELKGEAGSREYITRLSREYLEKILPPHCQVSMEPVRRWKVYDQEDIEMTYAKIDDEPITVGMGTLKEIVQKMFMEYFDLKFSIKGKSLFYLMPSTIRELALWVRQTCSFEKMKLHLDDIRLGLRVDENTVNQNAVYKKNMQWFWKEKLPGIFEKHLTLAESAFLKNIDELEPGGQILTLRKAFGEDDKIEKSLLEILGEQIISGTKEKQALSAMCISYLTVRLENLFMQWYHNENQSLREEALQDIKQYFNNGIWGKWEERLTGQIAFQNGVATISKIDFNALNKCLDYTFEGAFKMSKKEIEGFIQKNQNAIKNYQRLLLFFDFSSDFNFSQAKLGPNKGNSTLELGKEICKGSLALSNIMRPWEDKEWIIDDFLNNFLRILGISRDDRQRESILKLIDIRLSGLNQQYMLLPLQNIEFLIEVGQKLQGQLENHIIQFLKKPEDVLTEIQQYFMVIYNCLQEYDNMYGTSYKEKFEETSIAVELGLKEPENASGLHQEATLLYMLAKSILQVSSPKLQSMPD